MRVSKTLLSSFPALVTRGQGNVGVERLSVSDLPRECGYKQTRGSCDLLVSVDFSTLNYKDALVVSGRYPGLQTPMVGGCDIAGRVVEDRSGRLREGETVLSNGWGVGTDHYGGFAGLASLRSCWALQLPGEMTARQAATIGTAGYTAMLCIQAMEDIGLRPARGPVLVTGATGGVGSVAILLLAQLGYQVTAVSGKADTEAAYLRALGASDVLDRRDFEGEPRPLGRETYSGCVDSCGGRVLANVLPLIQYGGVVSACGLASGMALTSTVAPFILRGVTLAGVESALLPLQRRREVAICRPFFSVLPEDFDLMFNANVKQVINVTQVVAGKMIADGKKGSVVNVSSQASQAALADHTVYCATKGALDMITKVTALELGPQQIRVNAVNPTVTMTAMAKVGWSDPAKAGPMLAKIPLGRFAEVDDVTSCILFLLSEGAAMVNGVTLPIDGGFLAT